MATIRGRAGTYDLNVGVRLDIEDMVHLLSPFDVPLLGTYNGTDQPGSALPRGERAIAKKVEWLEDEILTPRSTLSAAHASGSGTLVLQAGDGIKFQPNDVVRVGASVFIVNSIAGDTLTVSEWVAGSDAAHAVDVDVVGVGSAPVEGADPEAARARDRDQAYNMTEIFGPYKVEITASEQAVAKYGVNSEWDYQVAARVKEASIAKEQAIIYGSRVEDTTNKKRTMGGFAYFITSNVDTATADLTESKLLDQAQTAFAAGGAPDTILTSPTSKRNISGFNVAQVTIDRDDRVRGSVVSAIDTDFGRLIVIMSRWVRSGDLFGYSRDQVSLHDLRPLSFEMLGKTGDADKGMVVSESTLRFRREKHAFRFSALA